VGKVDAELRTTVITEILGMYFKSFLMLLFIESNLPKNEWDALVALQDTKFVLLH
jgi:hypothetical protein